MDQAALEERILAGPAPALKPNAYFDEVDYPRGYQRRGILMLAARPRMVLGDDVGLGKTCEAVVALSYLKARDPGLKVLACTEKASLRQWAGEVAARTRGRLTTEIITAETHPPILNAAGEVQVSGKQRKATAFRRMEADITLTTYGMLLRYKEDLPAGLGDHYALVFDEPPFRNLTGTAKLCLNLSFDAARVYGLTATPVESRLEEMYGLLRVVWPGFFRSKTEFEDLYCKTEPVFPFKPFPRRTVGYRNLDHFRARIRPAYFGRLATDPEVDQELPEVVTKDVPVEMGWDQTGLVLDAMEQVLATPDGCEDLETLTALLRAQEMVNAPEIHGWKKTGSAKADALVELCCGSLAGQRVLVFTKSARTLEALRARLTAKKLRVGTIQGSMSRTAREAAIDAFMAEPARVDVLLITQAGGRAINLQRGGHLIFYDLPWTYGLYRQIVGRLRRTGSSHRAVVVWRFLARLNPACAQSVTGKAAWATIDHHTLRHVRRGKRVFDAVTGDQETIDSTKVNPKDLLLALATDLGDEDAFMRAEGVDLGGELT